MIRPRRRYPRLPRQPGRYRKAGRLLVYLLTAGLVLAVARLYLFGPPF